MKYILVPKKKNILITGASGFIGRHLSSYLQGKYNIFNLVRKEKGLDPVRNRIELDLRDIVSVKKFFEGFKKKHKISFVIHLASRLVSPDNSKDMNILCDNLKIAESVVEIAKLLKPKKIMNFSSIAVYPNRDGDYSEISQIRPSVNAECLYGLSKFCSENIIDFKLKEERIVISHLRIAQVYGDGMREDRIIPVMLRELREKNTITVLGEGRRISNFIYIEKLLKKIEVFINENLNGIYNIGDEHLSYLELAQRLIQQYGNNKSKIVKKVKGSKDEFYLDTTKVDRVMNNRKKLQRNCRDEKNIYNS